MVEARSCDERRVMRKSLRRFEQSAIGEEPVHQFPHTHNCGTGRIHQHGTLDYEGRVCGAGEDARPRTGTQRYRSDIGARHAARREHAQHRGADLLQPGARSKCRALWSGQAAAAVQSGKVHRDHGGLGLARDFARAQERGRVADAAVPRREEQGDVARPLRRRSSANRRDGEDTKPLAGSWVAPDVESLAQPPLPTVRIAVSRHSAVSWSGPRGGEAGISHRAVSLRLTPVEAEERVEQTIRGGHRRTLTDRRGRGADKFHRGICALALPSLGGKSQMTPQADGARREGLSRSGRPYVIRLSTPADCADFAQLLNDVAAERDWLIAGPGDGSVLAETVGLAAILGTGGVSLTLEVAGVVAGRVLVQPGRPPYEQHAGELAIVIGAGYRDDGMGTALVEAAVEWGRQSGLARLALRVFTTNTRAIAVYTTVGFAEEGVLRRFIRMPDGYRDLMVMALLT